MTRTRVESELRLPQQRTRRQRRDWTWAQGDEGWRRGMVGAPLLGVGFAIWAFGGVYGWAYGTAYWLIFGALGTLGVRCWVGKARLRWRREYIPGLLLALLVAVQYLGGLTAVKASTVTAGLHLGAGAALFVVLSQCFDGNRDEGWISNCFAPVTLALAVLAILQILTAARGIYWHFSYQYASPAGSFVNRNHFAGCMEMLLPVACVAAYRRRDLHWLYWTPWLAPPALGVAAVLLTASRGGFTALAAEAACGLVIAALWQSNRGTARRQPAEPPPLDVAGWLPMPNGARRRRRDRRRPGEDTRLRRRRQGLALLLAVGVTIVMVETVGTGMLVNRLENVDRNAPNLSERADLNRSSWQMFKEKPVAGWGLGTWADVYPAYATFNNDLVYEFAHDDYLQLLAETGAAGAMCVLLFWGMWTWGLYRDWPDLRSGRRGGAALSIAAAVACTGMLVHSLVDFNLHIPANLLLFFVLAAVGLAPNGERLSD